MAVSVYGARYGAPKAPATQFEIALCDTKMASIAKWDKPYSAFGYGTMGWARFEVKPTRVPKEFAVCLNFKPTQTNGVFVGWDGSTKGHSVVGTSGKEGEAFEQGDWMIRVEVDQIKGADALKGQ